MNKHELILPNEWLVHAVEINLLAYDSSREGHQDLLFLFATDKDGTAHEFTVTAPAMRYVAMEAYNALKTCLLYTSPSPRDRQKSRMPSSA